jgi:hypothetical protein
MWPHGDDGLGIAWLDGREMHPGTGHHGADHHGHPAAMMTLRTARFDATLSRHDERVLDRSVCDCCQTDSATTARGQLLVYRDRTGGEIRDIHAARLGADGWSTPARVHADDWEMPACPVNGPSVAARGDHVVVGWYTAAGDRPRVMLARSTDAGASFGPPVELDAGDHVQGRVAVALDGGRAWALWTTEVAGRQSIRLATLPADLAGVEHRTELARLAGRGRATGFAQLVARDGMATAAWTDVIDRQPALRAARIRP